jgi:hypothetical protein
VGCLLLVVSAHAGVAGQATNPAQPSADTSPGWVFTPSFSFGGGWDDNVLLQSGVGPPLGDYVTSLTPAGILDYNGRRLQLSSTYRGSFSIYRELTDLNTLDQYGRFSVRYRMTPRATIGVLQSIAHSPTTDIVELVAVPFERIGTLNSSTDAVVDVRLTARTTARTGYRLRLVDFDDEGVERLRFPGGHAHEFTSAVDHRLSKRLTLGGLYTFQHVRFEEVDSPVGVSDNSAPVLLHYAVATGEYRLTEVLTILGNLGIDYLAEVEDQPSRAGLAWKAGVVATWRRITASGSYERSAVPSFGFGGVSDNEELTGSIRGDFARRRAYWQTTVALRDNQPITPGFPIRRTFWWSAGTGYSIQPWLRIEGYYAFAAQDNVQVLGGRINRNRIGFQIVTHKPLRLRDK